MVYHYSVTRRSVHSGRKACTLHTGPGGDSVCKESCSNKGSVVVNASKECSKECTVMT